MKKNDEQMQSNHDFELGQIREIEAKRDDLARLAKKLFDSKKITAFAYIKVMDANHRKAI